MLIFKVVLRDWRTALLSGLCTFPQSERRSKQVKDQRLANSCEPSMTLRKESGYFSKVRVE